MTDERNDGLVAPEPDEPLEADETIHQLAEPSRPWWLAAAAILFLALWVWREVAIRVAREQLTSQSAEINRLEVENARLTQLREKLTADLESLASVNSRTIPLIGQSVAPSATGRVFWNASRQRVIAFVHGFPPNSADRTYQLWIVSDKTSQLINGGTFDVTQAGNGTVTVDKVPSDAKSFTVTLEPAGGSAQPSGEIYVSGTIGGS